MQTDEKRRVFDGLDVILDVIQERDANNNVTAQLVRDGNIGGILSRTTATGAAFYGYDGNGNVTLLTNSAGQDVGHYRYDAFGQTLEAEGPRAGENPYRFSTKEVHAASGLVDYGFRFYSPGLGRWMNRDPLEEEGGVNLYGFVDNNPVNDVDVYSEVGLRPEKPAIDPDSLAGRVLRAIDQVPWWADPMMATSTAGKVATQAAAKAAAKVAAAKAAKIAAAKAAKRAAVKAAANAAPTFTKSTVNGMITSSQLPKGKTSRGASLLAKRVADGLMVGVKPTQANADKILRDVLSRPLRTRGTLRAGQIDAIGRSFGREVGVRINTRTGEFIGFRTPDF